MSNSDLAIKASARVAPPIPTSKDDINGTWNFLEWGVDRIMFNLSEGVDLKTYMSLYTSIHNFCTAQKAAGMGSQQSNLNSNHRGAHLLGEDLYHRLNEHLKVHLAAVHAEMIKHTDEALLTYYIKEWKRYTQAGTYNHHLFRYLNRHWVKREMDEGKKDIYDIYTLHLVRWKEDMFGSTQNAVMDAVLRLVEKQRNGETIEQSKIKDVVNSFVSLGIDEADSTKTTLDVYRTYFEKPYLEATEKYYEVESHRFLAENSVVDYMKKAERRLDEEKERVPLFLLNEIMAPLMKCCENALIAKHATTLRDEFQILLDNDREDDMARMYKLLARIPEGLDPLRARFELHVRQAGHLAVEKVAGQGDSLDPKAYVDALLEVHTQYSALVQKAFTGESEFVRSLDNACREYVNRNKVCERNSSKSPELLAKHSDNVLKKSTKATEEDNMEKLLDQCMTIFKYVEDKDVFQKFYSRHLAKRLVNGTSASGDAETSMISKLKDASGFEYTNKLQRMFQDVQTSKDLNNAYEEWRSQTIDKEDRKEEVDATYQILGTGSWPLQPPTSPFAPPDVIIKTYERFQTFYSNKHGGRKLSWLWHLCKGEIRANYAKMNKVPYTFSVSTYQMAILLMFNDSNTVTYDDMAELTSLAKETLDPSIAIMIKAKVLTASPEGASPQSGTSYSLNYGFKNKKLKVNLNIAIKSEQKQEVEDTHKTIEEDRKMLMQSAIVRIMKSRKTMKHAQLVSETIGQIRSRFSPKVSDIKKCIDILIEKEYLERLEGDDLGYLA
ncbi:Cullin-domain-containing protein [Sphaerulina musiva SO2202]|uniref:Cullin-1 n=1 Tax=Sphaerulina musiva (strain SO2202) TaxID=692275 RepID=M3C402_SPHMS|nr:Cullin-domain-containing protein [Sphaerulina musiva SO2202]EMF14971.1 Cullin-domain-containing protein [Sphaerulina musiva SO2202]